MIGYYIMLKRKISLALFAGAAASSVLVQSASASASLPTLTINGSTVMNAYVSHNSTKSNDTKRSIHLANDASDLYFNIKGKISNGIEYGYKLGIQSSSGTTPVFQQNYVEFNGKFGTFQVGNVGAPSKTMIEDGGSIVGGMGAFDGGYHNVALLPAFVLRGNDNVGDSGYSTKIVYYTPTYYNLRFGISFTPDTSKAGDDGANKAENTSPNAPGNRAFLPNKKLSPYDLNNLTLALSFKKEVGNWGINLNGSYITGDAYYGAISDEPGPSSAKRTKAQRTNAYQLGTVISYRRPNNHLVQVGAGYLNNGKSRLETSFGSIVSNNPLLNKFVTEGSSHPSQVTFGNLYQGNSGQAWNLAAGYVMGIYKFSASYQGTERKTDATNKTRSSLYSVTADVVPVNGLKFFVEADYLKARTNEAAARTAGSLVSYGSKDPQRSYDNAQFKSNEAIVVAFGTKVNF